MSTVGASEAKDKRSSPKVSMGDFLNRFGLPLLWILLFAAFSVASPRIFLSWPNITNILGSQAVLVILTIGMLIPLTVGEFDISVAGLTSTCVMLIGVLNVQHGWPIAFVVVAVFAVVLLVGAINAFIVVGVGVSSLVATLGMGTLLMGAAYGISGLSIIGLSESLIAFARTKIFGLQMAFYYGLILTIAWWYVQFYTPLGRRMTFAGANLNVARLTGIDVNRLRVGAFMTCSLVAGFGALVLAGVLGSADPTAATGYLLPPFAAAFLGATSITPGRFNPWGAFIAVYFLVTGIVGLQIIGFSGWIEQVFYGGALVVAVTLSRLAAERLKGKSEQR